MLFERDALVLRQLVHQVATSVPSQLRSGAQVRVEERNGGPQHDVFLLLGIDCRVLVLVSSYTSRFDSAASMKSCASPMRNDRSPG